MPINILVTGGLGYIGSHTVVELINSGYNIVIVDNLSNSDIQILDNIEKITGQKPVFYAVDLCNLEETKAIFYAHLIDVVIHFAAFKSVSESVQSPIKYFQNNLVSLLNIVECMKEYDVKNLVFSSSATVYGQPDTLPVTEKMPFKKATSAYGSTKQIGEEILQQVTASGNIKNISLRYFNPVGAHASALIGELPKGVPNNLLPFITQTGIGKRNKLTVFGNDYATPDGTCIRDFIHVLDLAKAHKKACERLMYMKGTADYEVFNLGTGKGTSVLELIYSFEKISGLKLNYSFGPRRQADVQTVYADISLARDVLGWQAELGVDEMIGSSWKWEQALTANQ